MAAAVNHIPLTINKLRAVIGLAGLTFLLLMMAPSLALADEAWLRADKIELQTLDKITARISTQEGQVGVPFRYGTLQILIHACTYRPPTMAPEHAALMEIRTINHLDVIADTPIFKGWMFASSPALNALEHPVYDISVLACIKD